MVISNICSCCKYRYEVTWDDDAHYENAEVSEDWDDELYPEYCPFCGVHREYFGESDESDDELN